MKFFRDLNTIDAVKISNEVLVTCSINAKRNTALIVWFF